MERPIIIYQTNNLPEATLLRSVLEGSGIAVSINNASTVAHLGISAGIDLYVDASDEARALGVIDAFEQAPVDNGDDDAGAPVAA